MDGWWFNGQRHQWQSRWVWSHLYRQCTQHVASFHLVGYIRMSLQQFRGCSCRSLHLWLPCLSPHVLGGRFACSWREILDIFWGISRIFYSRKVVVSVIVSVELLVDDFSFMSRNSIAIDDGVILVCALALGMIFIPKTVCFLTQLKTDVTLWCSSRFLQ